MKGDNFVTPTLTGWMMDTLVKKAQDNHPEGKGRTVGPRRLGQEDCTKW